MAFIVTEDDRFFVLPEVTNSKHALLREGQRGISKKQVMLAYKYGRVIHSRRAVYHVIGNGVFQASCRLTFKFMPPCFLLSLIFLSQG